MAEYKRVIAVCGSCLSEEKEYSFLKELNKVCKQKGYVAVAFNFSVDGFDVDDDIMREKKLIELMGHLNCVAVIVLGETIKNDIMMEFIRKTVSYMNVPVFSLEYPLEGCFQISQHFGEGFKNMVRHVIEHHSCRKINMIAGVKDNVFSTDRVNAYKEVLEEYGIPFEEKRVKYGDFWDRPARTATEEFLAEDPEIPDAIVCANDTMAIACCDVLRSRGYRVPDDIIVTGFDGISSGKVNYPTISTVEPDNEGEVLAIFDLLEKIENAEIMDMNMSVNIPYRIRVNQSCGCRQIDDKESMNKMSALGQTLNEQKWHMMAMNKLMLFSNDLKNLSDMSPILEENLELWKQNLFFVAIYEQYMKDDPDVSGRPHYVSEDSCVTMFKLKDGENLTDYEVFKEESLMPNFEENLVFEDGYDMFMVRLLQTKSTLYGYLIEGLRNVDERCTRRCEEFALFLSTTINSVLKNQKVFRLNERLRRINKEIERVSVLDYLTELFNRRGFYDELYKLVEASENEGRYLTFFSIDMDGLKIINDTYGHNEGDFALKTLASAIKHFAMRNGICARYGGDEFVCAIITDQEMFFTADIIRERFQAFFEKNRELKEKPYDISASVGCKCNMITHNLDVEDIMRIADTEMYKDKMARRKNRG